MKLSELPIGTEALIIHSHQIPLRLIELGVLQGHHVILLKKGWKGDPVLIAVNGKKIAISKELAEKIIVRKREESQD